MIVIVLLVALIGGLLLSFGAQCFELLLTVVGSIERVSLLSICIFGVIAAYWAIFAIAMYREANRESYEEGGNDETSVKERPKNLATKVLVVGILLTFIWLLFFALTDKSAIAAQQFINWQNKYSVQLEIARYIGNLSLAFSAGIIFTNLTVPRRRAKKKSKNEEKPKKESDSEENEVSGLF